MDKITRNLTLKENLDRESVDRHEIRIISTNLETYPARRPSDDSLLIIEITVEDVNDNPPTFQYKNYAVGVSETDNVDKTILTLFATDPDLDDEITYTIVPGSTVATGENLDNVKDTAFEVNPRNGELKLKFQVQPNMKGYFDFEVQATDLVDHTDEASVRIYLVAEANRVTFVFQNDTATVQSVDQQRLAEIFSIAYQATCIIDEIREKLIDGAAQEKLTDLRVHFVSLEHEPIDAKSILLMSTDMAFITDLNYELVKLSLKLQGLPTEAAATPDNPRSMFLEILLIVLSSVLAVLLTSLAVIYFINARSYKRQIKALTESNFGSNSSDINSNIRRLPNALPNTNQFATEQSNPVMSMINSRAKRADMDTQSILSSDESDDFAGLYDSPIFNITKNNDGVTAAAASKNPLGQKLSEDNSTSSYI